MISRGVLQIVEQFPRGSECAANGAKLRDSQQLAGNGDGENLRQVVDSEEVGRARDESGGGGLIEKPLALLWGPADGQPGVVGGGGAHGGGGERRELLAYGAPFQDLEALRLD